MARQAIRRLTVDEFIDLPERPEIREELIDGQVFAMAPPKDAHGTIVVNVAYELRSKLKSRGRGVGDAGLRIDQSNLILPNLAVTCSPRDEQGMTVDPLLIIEVLTPSTRTLDLGIKADAYSPILSCRESWLIDSERRAVRLWRRQGDGWIVSLPLTGSTEFRSEVLDATVTLDSLYPESGL